MKSSLSRFALISLLSLSAGTQNLYALQSESLSAPVSPDNPSDFFLPRADSGLDRQTIENSNIPSTLERRVESSSSLHAEAVPLKSNKEWEGLQDDVISALSEEKVISITPSSSEKNEQIIDAVLEHITKIREETGNFPSLKNVAIIIKEMANAAKTHHIEFSGSMITHFFEILHASGHGPQDALSPDELKNTLERAAGEIKLLIQGFKDKTPQIAEIKLQIALKLMDDALKQEGKVLSPEAVRAYTNKAVDDAIKILHQNDAPITPETVLMIHSIVEQYKDHPEEKKRNLEKAFKHIHAVMQKLKEIYGKEDFISEGTFGRALYLHNQGVPLTKLTKTDLTPKYMTVWAPRIKTQQDNVSKYLKKLGENPRLTRDDKKFLIATEEHLYNSNLSQAEITLEVAKVIVLIRKEKLSPNQTKRIIDDIRKAPSGKLKNLSDFVQTRLKALPKPEAEPNRGTPSTLSKIPSIYGHSLKENVGKQHSSTSSYTGQPKTRPTSQPKKPATQFHSQPKEISAPKEAPRPQTEREEMQRTK
ncbi:MAG: hypothetical protein JSS34_00720 [Proteobacteria bacterium]|nr:hypothetical protein [Pseudomonadota bacterium]